MLELLLQKFLRSGGTTQELEEKYAITSTRHPKYPELVLFKYSQIDSDFSQRIVQESRGIILDSHNNWKVICRSLKKYFPK